MEKLNYEKLLVNSNSQIEKNNNCNVLLDKACYRLSHLLYLKPEFPMKVAGHFTWRLDEVVLGWTVYVTGSR